MNKKIDKKYLMNKSKYDLCMILLDNNIISQQDFHIMIRFIKENIADTILNRLDKIKNNDIFNKEEMKNIEKEVKNIKRDKNFIV